MFAMVALMANIITKDYGEKNNNKTGLCGITSLIPISADSPRRTQRTAGQHYKRKTRKIITSVMKKENIYPWSGERIFGAGGAAGWRLRRPSTPLLEDFPPRTIWEGGFLPPPRRKMQSLQDESVTRVSPHAVAGKGERGKPCCRQVCKERW